MIDYFKSIMKAVHLVWVSSKGRSHLTDRMNEPWTLLSYVLGIMMYPPLRMGFSPPIVVDSVVVLTGRKLV